MKEQDSVPFAIVGAGAGGIGVVLAHLRHVNIKSGIPASQNLPLLLEQHTTLGGCAGFFVRTNPKRFFDVGATQLTACKETEIQGRIFLDARIDNQNKFQFQRYEFSEQIFHVEKQLTKVRIYATGQVSVLEGFQEKEFLQEMKNLENFLKKTFLHAQILWLYLETFPRLPLTSLLDILYNLKNILFKHPKALPFALFGPFLPFSLYAKFFGLKGKYAQKIVDGMLLVTTQTKSKNASLLAGVLGSTVVQAGMYKCPNGMMDFWQLIQKRILQSKSIALINSANAQKIQISDNGWVVTYFEKGEEKTFSTRNLFLNFTLWNAVEILENIPGMQENLVFQKWQKKLNRLNEKWEGRNPSTWLALSLYGQLAHMQQWPTHPFTVQIFPSEDEVELSSALNRDWDRYFEHPIYVSISALSQNNLRTFTASTHLHPRYLSEAVWKDDAAKIKLKKNFEIRVQTGTKTSHISSTEFATPHTFARYTKRKNGAVGGFPQSFLSPLPFDVPGTLKFGPTR